MRRRDDKRYPLRDLIGVAQSRIVSLVEEVNRNPPTHGVVAGTREKLAAELEKGPICLLDAAGQGAPDPLRARLDEHVERGARLAEWYRAGAVDEFDRRRLEVEEHLREEDHLAKDLEDEVDRPPGALADAYGRARDLRLYQL